MHVPLFRHIGINRTNSRVRRLTLLVVVANGCGGSGATTALPGPDEVVIRNYAFSPSPRNVAPGTTVTWTNSDGDEHTVSGDEGPETWESGSLARNATFSRTFGIPGTYRYSCSIHPEMRGRIIVGQAAFYKSSDGTVASFTARNVVSETDASPSFRGRRQTPEAWSVVKSSF